MRGDTMWRLSTREERRRFDMLGRSGKFPPNIFETVSTEMQSGAT